VNTERLNGILNWLESAEEALLFNMGTFTFVPNTAKAENNWCGTSCCLAGYTVITYGDFVPGNTVIHVFEDAWKLLELTYAEARALFYCKSLAGRDLWLTFDGITRSQAAQAVRNLIDCGDPKWEVICAYPFP